MAVICGVCTGKAVLFAESTDVNHPTAASTLGPELQKQKAEREFGVAIPPPEDSKQEDAFIGTAPQTSISNDATIGASLREAFQEVREKSSKSSSP